MMVRNTLSAGIAFLVIDLKRKIHFSFATIGQIFNAIVLLIVQVSLWRYVKLGPDPTYIARYFAIVAFMRPAIQIHVERDLEELHATGRIIYDMSRPQTLMQTLFLRNLSTAIVAMISVGIPSLMLIPLLYNLGTFSWRLMPFFAISVAAGYVCAWLIAFSVGISVFRLKDTNGILSAYNFLFPFCAGAMIPFDAFPRAIRTVFFYLPFRGTYDLPIRVSNADSIAEAMRLIGIQGFWIAALLIITILVQKRGLRRLEVYGG